jgi:hypothetical protein
MKCWFGMLMIASTQYIMYQPFMNLLLVHALGKSFCRLTVHKLTHQNASDDVETRIMDIAAFPITHLNVAYPSSIATHVICAVYSDAYLRVSVHTPCSILTHYCARFGHFLRRVNHSDVLLNQISMIVLY